MITDFNLDSIKQPAVAKFYFFYFLFETGGYSVSGHYIKILKQFQCFKKF